MSVSSHLQQLAPNFTGQLLQPADAGYDEARRVHNGLIDKRPALIARCQGTADVAVAVRLARSLGLEIGVRGGGHNVGGRATIDNGVMIDLAPTKGIHVDPRSRTARAQGGVLWKELNCETQVHGLATTGGVVGTTGIAGLALGGGIGWLMPKYGLALDNLRSAEMVMADGSVKRASADENADLYWAIRGGGGNFGIAASLEYDLHDVGPMIAGGLVAHPLRDQAPGAEVLPRDLRDAARRNDARGRADHRARRIGQQAGRRPGRALRPAGRRRSRRQTDQGLRLAGDGRDGADSVLRPEHPARRLPAEGRPQLLEGAVRGGPQRRLHRRAGRRPQRLPFADEPGGHRTLPRRGQPHTCRGDGVRLADHRLQRRHHLAVGRPAGDRPRYRVVPRDVREARAVSRLDALRELPGCGRSRRSAAIAYGPNYPCLRELKTKYDPDNVFHVNVNIRPR